MKLQTGRPTPCTDELLAESRKLLGQHMVLGAYITTVNREALATRPKNGARGLVRRQRKARRKAHSVRLQRVSWCSHFEKLNHLPPITWSSQFEQPSR